MECEFKFIQQWRAKLLFHIAQQLNISKTLRSAFPNHGTMTSVFLYQESAFMNQPVLFIYRKEGGRQSEQSKKFEIRIHVAGGTESQRGKEQTGIGGGNPQ